MILLALRPGAAVFLVGEDEACGCGAGERIDLDTGAVAQVDIVGARAHDEWAVPEARAAQAAALEGLHWYGSAITVEAAAAMVGATGRRFLHTGPL